MKVVLVVKGLFCMPLLPTFNCFAAGFDVKKDKFGSCLVGSLLSPEDCSKVAD